MSTDETKPDAFDVKDFIRKWAPVAMMVIVLAKVFGFISPEQAKEIQEYITVQDNSGQQVQPKPPEPIPSPAPKPDSLTPEQIADLIKQAIDAALKEKPPEPSPAEDAKPAPAPTPQPVSQVKIRLCDETGQELTDSEIEAGQLFRVSALGCGDEIGWHPVESGDVNLSASTDGKEFCGYLEAGQWVEFSLTDFASKTQASLRVTCLTAPQPPPDDEKKKPDPKPEPKAQNVRIFVVYNPDKISPDAAIVLNANEMWDGFTDAGNDWKWIGWDTEDSDEKQIVRDAAGIGLPAVVVYDKSTGKKLTAEELPKSVIATKGLVERYTGGK